MRNPSFSGEQCPIGYHRNSETSDCDECSQGTFTDTVESPECTPCAMVGHTTTTTTTTHIHRHSQTLTDTHRHSQIQRVLNYILYSIFRLNNDILSLGLLQPHQKTKKVSSVPFKTLDQIFWLHSPHRLYR